MEIEGINIERLNHSSFKIKNDKIIYIDPFKIEGEKADIILITHEHFDHCSIEDIEKIIKDDTVLVVTHDCVSKLNRFDKNKLKVVNPGSKLNIDDIGIEAVAAYNVNKFRSPGIVFHPKEDNKVGYIVTIKGKRIYHAGDTDFIEEMKNIKVDVALLPVSGTYVMTAKEAAEAALVIKPKVAIPAHYGSIVGSREDAKMFKKLAEKYCKVIILD